MPRLVTTRDDPSISEALNSSESTYWKGAIREEFATVTKAGTYVRDSKPPERALQSGIILKLKRDQDGHPARFKARLVARGNLQNVLGTSYANRYAPVACFDLV